jgi:hypothetical protein
MSYEESQGLGGLGSLKSTNDLSGTVSPGVTNGNPVGTLYPNGANLIMKQDPANDNSFVPAAAATDIPIGVLDDNPMACQAGNIKSVGGTIKKVLSGAAVTRGQRVVSDAYGRGIPYAGVPAFVVGIAMESVAAAGLPFAVELRFMTVDVTA